jgi:putative hydrolase of the HAD superfamily
VRALILDYGGVLTTRSPTGREDFQRLFGASMLEYRDAAVRAAAELGGNPVDLVETGQITTEQFQSALGAALPNVNVDALGPAYYAQHISNPEMLGCVADHHARGVTTVLMTNAAADWTAYWSPTVPGLEEIFDHVVISGSVGARKPDRRIFEHTLDLLAGIPAAECVFVDDEEANCAAAEAVGMSAIRFVDDPTTIAAIARLAGVPM